MRRLRSVFLAALVMALTAPLAVSDTQVPDAYQVLERTEIASGVEYLSLKREGPNQMVRVARVAPNAPVLLKEVSARDRIIHRWSELELPSEMCKRVGCIAGVNGDFHNPSTNQPLGGVVSGGRLIRSPEPGHDQVSITGDGHLLAGLPWSATITASDGATATVNGVNVERRDGSLVLYTPDWGTTTPVGAGTELVIRSQRDLGALGLTSSVEIVGVRSGSGPILPGHAVLSGSGASATLLRDLWDRSEAGSIGKQLQLVVSSTVAALESIGGRPVLLRNGQRAFPDSVDDNFTRSRHPRTLVGWNPVGEFVLVTVDGRHETARGMSLGDAADLLLGLGMTDGINLDGGGGTTFVANGMVKNSPSDDGDVGSPNPTSGSVERPTVNALVIVPKPTPPTTTTVPVPTTAPAVSPGGPGTVPSVTGGPVKGGEVSTASVPNDNVSPEGDSLGNPPSGAGPGKLFAAVNKAKGTGKGRAVGRPAGDGTSFSSSSTDTTGSSKTPASGGRSGGLAFGEDSEEDGGDPSLVGSFVGIGIVGALLIGLAMLALRDRKRPTLWM